MRKQKGFTLIEILIVVIILAVLAAMILPRFLGQTENAYIAEAQQVLGVLRRAQANAFDLTQGYVDVDNSSSNTTWASLGLKKVTTTNFGYTCSSGSCTAYRGAAATAATNGSVSLSIDGVFTCDMTKYTTVTGNKGCRPVS